MHADTFQATAAPSPYLPFHPRLAPPAAAHDMPAARPLALHLAIPPLGEIATVFGGLDTYLAYLKREAAMRAALFAGMNELEELRFSGVSPACLPAAQTSSLMAHLGRHFQFPPGEEGDFEVDSDPLGTSGERLRQLRKLGFNRIGLSVCDDGAGPARVRALAASARATGFRSVRVRLAYGLPGQGGDLLRRMLATIVAARPDRVTLLAHAGAAQAPGGVARRMHALCTGYLADAGYGDIGGGAWALPGDRPAQQAGAAPRIVGCGLGAAGSKVAAFGNYYALLDRYELPVAQDAGRVEAA